ncbi:hypothetical protein GCM10009593_17270 [Microlunatus antarcticus]
MARVSDWELECPYTYGGVMVEQSDTGGPGVRTGGRTTRRYWVIAAIAVVAALLVVVSLLRPSPSPGADSPATGTSQASSPSPAPSQAPTDEVAPDGSSTSDEGSTEAGSSARPGEDQDLSRRVEGDPMALGSVNAPVVLVEYADFRCPFCGVFARETKPALMHYVEAGTLRIEFRDMPIFGEESAQAALAGRAAADQGRFWPFYDAVYAAAPARGHASLTRAKLVDLARTAGVPDLARFESDLDGQTGMAGVQADEDEAGQLGVPSTPAFFVNTETVLGAQPTAVFTEKIDRLARS